jgi:hypothetical protein
MGGALANPDAWSNLGRRQQGFWYIRRYLVP